MNRRFSRLFLLSILLFAAAVLFPLVAGNYAIRLASMLAMEVGLALAWNIIGGFAGYPSFATAAFFGLGAYATGILATHGVSSYLAWLCAGGIAAAFAGLLGLAMLHLRGHYFAIASLLVADALREIINGWTSFTGGGMGINLPLLPGDVTVQARIVYAALMLVALAAFLTNSWLGRSRFGFALQCIEQNEDAAVMIGVASLPTKTAAFMLSALFPGIIGGIYASWVTYIDPNDVFDVLHSIEPIVVALLGGVGTVMGPIIGGAVLVGLEEAVWRNLLQFHEAVLGILVTLLVLALPHGLQSLGAHNGWLWRRIRRTG
jgi:branched-chain amino acid transport system permease protein